MLDDFLLFSFSFFFPPLPANHAPPPIDNCSFSVRFFLDSCPRERHLTEQCVDISKEDWAGWWKRKLPRIEAWAHGPVMRPTLHSLGRATEGEKARYHWNTLERKKERGGPRERTSGAHRGKLICAQPGSFNPSPSATLAREKIDTVTLRGVNRRDELPLFFSSSSACFSFLSFFFFKFHEGQIRYGKYVSRVVASYRVRERKYISVFMRETRETRRIQSGLRKKKLVRVCPAS